MPAVVLQDEGVLGRAEGAGGGSGDGVGRETVDSAAFLQGEMKEVVYINKLLKDETEGTHQGIPTSRTERAGRAVGPRARGGGASCRIGGRA